MFRYLFAIKMTSLAVNAPRLAGNSPGTPKIGAIVAPQAICAGKGG